MTFFKRTPRILLFLAVLTLPLLASCGNAAPATTISPSTTPVLATATPAPTETPTPAPARVLLIASPEAGQVLANEVRAALPELAASTGLILEERPALQPGEVGPEVKVAVLLAPPANLNDLVASAPTTQFIVFSAAGLEPGANLNVIRYASEHQSFIAGYLSTLVAGDWRAAGLLPADGPLGERLAQVFENGGHYLCGRCLPLYAPFVNFPLSAALPASAGAPEWQSSAEMLNRSVIYVYYVAPEAASPELLNWLVQQNVVLFGGQTPPAEARPRWAATIRLDGVAALSEVFAGAAQGKGNQRAAAKLKFDDVAPELLSPGRQLRAEQVYRDLADGLIEPFNPPQ